MKSLNVRKTEKGFLIEGYPDAVAVRSIAEDKDAKELMYLSLHQSDVNFCIDILKRVSGNGALQSDQLLTGSLWIACICRFFKCFQDSKSRVSLKIGEVLKEHPPEAKRAFDYLKDLRNKHLLHDENPYSQAFVGVVINPKSATSKVADVVVSVNTLRTDNESHFKSLGQIISVTNEWISKRREFLHKRLAKRYEEYDYADLLGLPSMTFIAPGTDKVATKR